MNSQDLINVLKRLKKEGISYKYISQCCDINISTFYQYLKRNNFPLLVRKKIEQFINDNFSEVLNG